MKHDAFAVTCIRQKTVKLTNRIKPLSGQRFSLGTEGHSPQLQFHQSRGVHFGDR